MFTATNEFFKNMNKVFEPGDFENAYFEMEDNPMESLCETF